MPRGNFKKRGSSNLKNKPEGARLLWDYSALVALLFLFLVFATNTAIFFGLTFKGFIADILHLAYFLSFMTVLYGLTYKKAWVYYWGIFVFGLWIANSVVSLIVLMFVEPGVLSAFYLTVAPLIVFFVFLNSSVLWYMYEKKSYFQKAKGKSTLVDDIFKKLLIVFYLCFIFFVAVILLQRVLFYDAYDSVEGMNFSDIEEISNYCQMQHDEVFRDACYVYAANEFDSAENMCERVKADLYRLDCLRMVENEC